MKWLGVAAVLCLAVGTVLWFPGRHERACYRNLTMPDHALNCPGRQEIFSGVISDGVWTDKESLLDLCWDEYLRCPITGAEYVLTFTVGEHPYCPVHGRLIEKYGYRPHDPPGTPPGIWSVKRIAGLLLLGLGIPLVVMTGLVALARRSRTQGRTAQPSDRSVAAGDSEGRGQ